MSVGKEQISAKQAAYTRWGLPLYDLLVLRLSHRFIWECPAERLEQHYNEHVTGNHLEVGVGTGYLLDRCHFPSSRPRITLMDISPTALAFTSRRIARYKPETYHHSVLDPISIDGPKFDSIAINDVIHCLPSTMESKASALDHLKRLMNPAAVIFGSTLLQGGVTRNAAARLLMGLYNKQGVFSNSDDSLDGLKGVLDQRFSAVSVEVVGCSALFSARN